MSVASVSLNFYRICASFGKKLNISRQLVGKKLETICNDLSVKGNVNLLEWTVDSFYRNDHTYRYNQTICKNAATFGHIELMKWTINRKYNWGVDTIVSAIEFGQFETLMLIHNLCVCKYKRTKKMITSCTKITRVAIEKGYLDMLIWLNNNGYKIDLCSVLIAAKNGDLKIVSWMYENYNDLDSNYWSNEICKIVASNGRLEILKWLKEKDCFERYSCNENISKCAT